VILFTRRYLIMRPSGETISQTVENLLANSVSETLREQGRGNTRKVYAQKLAALAEVFGLSHLYMARKIKAGTWTVGDLDKLAAYFHMYPSEFLPSADDDWGSAEEKSNAEAVDSETTGERDPAPGSGLESRQTE
jgi:hypothetical protein